MDNFYLEKILEKTLIRKNYNFQMAHILFSKEDGLSGGRWKEEAKDRVEKELCRGLSMIWFIKFIISWGHQPWWWPQSWPLSLISQRLSVLPCLSLAIWALVTQ